MIAPIALFVYNRISHTIKTVEALQKNFLAKESDLIIFSDGPKNQESVPAIQELRAYLKTISGFKKVKIIERNKNLGLAESIISGVTEIINQYDKIIVLEDDLVTSPHFLNYMNDALTMYEHDNKVVSIHGYTYPTKGVLPDSFFLRGADCWGWATWKRGWQIFESDGKKLISEIKKHNLIKKFNFDETYNFFGLLQRQNSGLADSWAIRWYASAFLKNMLTLYPGKSLVNNIGQDGSGTHSNRNDLYATDIYIDRIHLKRIPIEDSKKARKIIQSYFQSLKPSILKRILRKLNLCID